MSDWCNIETPLAVDVDLCDDSDDDLVEDEKPYIYARAVHEAVIAIVGLDCHTDGDVDWGEPGVDKTCCCGQIKTGIISPETFGGTPCYQVQDYRYRVIVTWDSKKTSVAQVSREARRLSRKIEAEAARHLQANGGPRAKFSVTGSTNGVTVLTGCEHLTLTIQA